MTSFDNFFEKNSFQIGQNAAIKRIPGGIRNRRMHVYVGIPSDPLPA